MKKKSATLTPTELRPENVMAFKVRMDDLDIRHKRARTPAVRMRIEEQMRTLRKELRDLEVAEAQLDWAVRGWWKKIEKDLEAVLGRDNAK